MVRRISWLVIIAGVVGGCGGAGSNGEDPLGGPYPVADLSIVVEHPDRDTIEYRLTCLGDTATVTPEGVDVDEQAACLALADADVASRLVNGPPDGQVCTEEYGGPDEATITGTIDEQSVDTTVDRTNGCGISDWDDLLTDLLPPAVGVTD